MKLNNLWLLAACFVAMLFLSSACGPSQAELDATATQIAADIFSTQTAQAPTATNTPTETPIPTATPTSTPTPTELPTNTPTVEPGAFITSTLENGWIHYESREDGFSITLPPEWLQIDLNPDTFEDSLAIAAELNPDMGGMFTSDTVRSLVAGGIKFYALELAQETIDLGLPASANILIVDTGLELPLDSVLDLNLTQIESFADPAVPFTNQPVTIAGNEAAELSYATSMAGIGGETLKMMLMQYLMVDGSVQYVLTFGAPLELADSYTDTFRDIAQSFQLTE